MSETISIADLPVKNHNDDLLETKGYAETLAKFITDCQTPMTIGVQGEWGSGKTSLLNMVKYFLAENVVEHKVLANQNLVTQKTPGEQYFECIWINTWEHSLLKSSEECLFSIIEEIIDQVAVRAGTWAAAKKAKSALSTLLRGTARVGASFTMGAHAGQVADEILSSSNGNGVAELRMSLKSVVNEIHNKKDNPCYRFVIFVDDLDRLEPAVAVQILELLKNIFELEHCVFVLAIDYQVVVKGLKEKFGEPNDSNEWEFRAFFDKIIQVPFMMPMAQYKLDEYVLRQLTDTIPYFDPKTEVDELKRDRRLGKVVQLTIGNNPRSIKRLLNSVSLIRLQNKGKISGETVYQFELKQLIFTLVCIQIAYPKTYELLLREPDFRTWNSDFFEKVTASKPYKPVALTAALEGIQKVNASDFDDDWEEVLFKIIWVMEWQRARVVDISRVLSVIDEKILGDGEEETLEIVTEALKMTAVTSVATTDESILTKNQTDIEADDFKEMRDYWKRFRKALESKKCSFNQRPIPSTYKNRDLECPMQGVKGVKAVASINSKTPLKFVSYREDRVAFKKLMIAINKNKADLEAKVGVNLTVHNIEETAGKLSLGFDPPPSVTKMVSPAKDKKIGDAIIEWTQAHIEAIEQFIIEMDKKKDELETYVSSQTPQ
jgi:hypothetical protein